MMKRLLIISTLLVIGITTSKAQDNFDAAIGIRASVPLGISYKQFIGRFSAVEGIVGVDFRNSVGILATGLYEYHFRMGEQTNTFIGAGATIGAGKGFVLNGDLIVGVGYTFTQLPINASFDYKPYINLLNLSNAGDAITFDTFALSVRYTF